MGPSEMLNMRRWRYRVGGLLVGVFTVIFLVVVLLYSDLEVRNEKDNINILARSLEVVRHFQHGIGCKANYSIPAVDTLIEVYLSKQTAYSPQLIIQDSQPYTEFIKGLHLQRKNTTLLRLRLENQSFPESSKPEMMSSHERFYRAINQHELYDPYTDDTLDNLLKDLVTSRINQSLPLLDYNQVTIALKLDNGATAVVKPKRFTIKYEASGELLYFSEVERFNSEIAGFHLDRALGFHRAPPTIGRLISVTKDITKSPKLVLYTSPVGNHCFTTVCKGFINAECCVCGDSSDQVEVAMTIALPGRQAPSNSPEDVHPWRRSYNMTKTAWELDGNYCENLIKVDSTFNHGRLLLDLVDMAIFDFLTGNMNREYFERFKEFGEDTYLLHIDNSKGFNNAKHDCMSCLAPLRQCCLIRVSTLVKLIKLYQGPDSLSQVMRTSLNSDPVSPVLLEPYLDALDRRVGKVLNSVSECINNGKTWQDVVIDDGVH